MAAIATPETVRDNGNLPSTVTDAILNPQIAKASIEVKELLGATLYAEIVAEASSERKTNVQIAESLMALSFAVFALNIETQGTGIVRSKGWDQSRSELLSQNECQALSDRWKGEATKILSAYIPNANADADEETADAALERSPVLDLGHMSMGAL